MSHNNHYLHSRCYSCHYCHTTVTTFIRIATPSTTVTQQSLSSLNVATAAITVSQQSLPSLALLQLPLLSHNSHYLHSRCYVFTRIATAAITATQRSLSTTMYLTKHIATTVTNYCHTTVSIFIGKFIVPYLFFNRKRNLLNSLSWKTKTVKKSVSTFDSTFENVSKGLNFT